MKMAGRLFLSEDRQKMDDLQEHSTRIHERNRLVPHLEQTTRIKRSKCLLALSFGESKKSEFLSLAYS
jgi:hypothetical protein